MARIVRGSPFKIDWKDKDAVIAYAKTLGKGQTVFKHPDRDNYNITHTECPERYEGCEIVYQTK
ncbi:hypothetical protein SmphiM6_120 [Sinorhizobium phage phiM6]|nr:hypothetical protein SmphiM6_120 [Sinorhizobium phage phiM6]